MAQARTRRDNGVRPVRGTVAALWRWSKRLLWQESRCVRVCTAHQTALTFLLRTAVLEFRVFLIKLVGAFWFERLPAGFDDDSYVEVLTRHPTQSYVQLTSFDPPADVH